MAHHCRSAYVRIGGFGLSDPIFHYRNFRLLQPKFLKQVLEQLEKEEQQRINIESMAIARFASTQVTGKTGKPVYTESDFLPYKIDDGKSTKSPDQSVGPQTAKVMQRLIDSGRLPSRVAAAAKARLNG